MSGYSDSDLQFADFSNTVLYSPIPYIPQVAGIWVGRALGLSTLVTAYLVRLLNLVAGAALGYLALKELRFSGRMFHFVFLLISMPMTVSLFASANADAVTIGLAFLVFGLAMSLRQEFERKKFYWVLVGTVLLSLSKSLYFFLPLILLPSAVFKIENRRERWTRGTALWACAFIPALLWIVAVKNIYSPALPTINPGEQLKYFLSHQPTTTLILVQSYIEHPIDYARSFIGQLGWLDTPISGRATRIYLFLLSASLVLVPHDAREKPVSWIERGGAWILLVGLSFLLSLMMYLTWMPVGAANLEGIQGRYFIPVAPLLLLAIPALIRLEARYWQYWRALLIVLWVIAAVHVPRAVYLRYWA